MTDHLCNFDPATRVCHRCGYKAAILPLFRVCRPPPPKPDWKPIMVGDLVEKALTTIGITQERVERLTRTEGKPGGCGCAGRKKWLNEAGAKVQYAVRDAGKAAAKFYLGES